jgi:L-threonylcarbamoyladenylate synthase
VTPLRRIEDLRDAAGVLASGGVLLLATDTVPGLHARADRPAALARLQELKERPRPRPLVVLAASLEAAECVAGPLAPRQRAYADLCWPGPFSLVLPARPGVPAAVTAGAGTVAVRVPASAPLRRLLAAVGWPLASTSANRAGEAPAGTLAEAVAVFGERVDGVWSASPPVGGAGAAGHASAVLDLTTWPPRLLRAGPAPPPPWAGLDDAPGDA